MRLGIAGSKSSPSPTTTTSGATPYNSRHLRLASWASARRMRP
eukprot:CAMPEP_0204019954 /NCGR_PEP_ID=MMETSP0360-20130528/29098_1 /ASSEMBLY_ACC=CAM_ASM_000342 /TAXON_ID=268821 /ORGANISM="Scrippsiella Hangoei, Strain SHTV-5" /LENGTH=42 /DNA_ID= /DNA_START= /DNA_END= /DNA_ORIENTATION=